ncbi:Methyltransferase domain protein [Sulfitobacter sp. THAF37]|uniref:DUF938 domain-containing protein n=1 Tax=Sulfitobacter sp. THAF37 TaxID=2587855 RepID=UPI0012696E6B|nr:DUF938 domain-containing protein [Sulfitobacter sp. THAF37]QFT58896.1 Methyltransferase domain protein [Sulfitobacter sp. THAF37]
MSRKLPPTASVADQRENGKLFAPAAARNADAICTVLADHAPATGRALEIASGTGQHVVAFARALPDLRWHPTEIDPARRASIDAHAAEAALPNIAPAQQLDATEPGWAARWPPVDLVVLVNLLHLVSEPEARHILDGVASALVPGGVFVLYGPFRRSGTLTSDGDRRFDAELRSADPLIGYKDDLAVADWLRNSGLEPGGVIEMPANNLALVARKPV